MQAVYVKPLINGILIPTRARNMSELQNEAADLPEVTEQVESSAEIETQSADLATDSEAQHEQQAQDTVEKTVNQDAINAAINKKHREKMEAERKAAEYKAQVEEFQRKEQEQLAKSFESIPPIPDAFDDDYEQKLAERDKALAAKAQYDAQQNIMQQQQQQQQYQQQIEQQRLMQESINKYEERAVKDFGISKESLNADVQTVNQLGISPELGLHVMNDDQGALITQYLAKNIDESANLFAQNPFQQAQYIENVIKPKLEALKPKQTAAPTPPTNLTGNGADKDLGKYKHLSGAKFE